MNRVFNLLLVINTIILIIFTIYISFSNLHMNETRLFLVYWKDYIALIIYPLVWGITKIFRS